MGSDFLDLRDLGAELDELRARVEDEDQIEPLDESESDRLDSLLALADELGGDLSDIGNNYEPTLIAESHFVEYAEELAHDIGAVNSDHGWPLSFINWDLAAEALKNDYMEVSFDGDTYLIRSW